MKNFLKIAQGVDVLPLMRQLQVQPDLWNENNLRTTFSNSPHAQADDIWLFFNDTAKTESPLNDCDVIPYRGWYSLPEARPLVYDLLRRTQGVRLGRTIITRLTPGKVITPHTDMGTPATYYTRYQIALQCEPGNLFKIEDEAVELKTGDVWLINNKAEHSVSNTGLDDRIVMIVDIRHED